MITENPMFPPDVSQRQALGWAPGARVDSDPGSYKIPFD